MEKFEHNMAHVLEVLGTGDAGIGTQLHSVDELGRRQKVAAVTGKKRRWTPLLRAMGRPRCDSQGETASQWESRLPRVSIVGKTGASRFNDSARGWLWPRWRIEGRPGFTATLRDVPAKRRRPDHRLRANTCGVLRVGGGWFAHDYLWRGRGKGVQGYLWRGGCM